MKIIKIIATVCLVFIGSLLQYDKLEVSDIPITEQIEVKEEIIEDVVDEIEEDKPIEIILKDDKESTNNKQKVKSNSTPKTSKKKTNKINNKKKDNKANNTKTLSEEVKDEKPKEETKPDKPKEDLKPKCSDLYESITHGKVDKSTKSACVSYGNKIQNNELDEVLDYNEEHGNVRKPTSFILLIFSSLKLFLISLKVENLALPYSLLLLIFLLLIKGSIYLKRRMVINKTSNIIILFIMLLPILLHILLYNF